MIIPDLPVPTGDQLRDMALDSLDDAHGEWIDRAVEVVHSLCARVRFFTTDTVWHHIADMPPEPRAMGAAMRIAKRLGMCRTTPRTEPSTRPGCHSRPVRVWESLL